MSNKICPFYNLYNRECTLGEDDCIGDEYHPENCDVYLEGKEN
jgi:hypothetical protein